MHIVKLYHHIAYLQKTKHEQWLVAN